MTPASNTPRVLHGANYHGLHAKTTREFVADGLHPLYRVECACGWESGWNYDWRKSLDGHIYREQKKAAA